MEIEEEEVKWEAMEPEKDEPVLTLGLRRRRAPERPHPQISILSQLTRLRQLDLKQFPELRPLWLGLSSIKHMLIRLTMLDLRTLKQLSELRPSRLKHFPEPVDLFPIKRLLPPLRAFASLRPWMQLSDIDLSNLDILPEIVGSFFYQAHDKILDSIAAFFSDLFHFKTVTLSDDDVRRLVKSTFNSCLTCYGTS